MDVSEILSELDDHGFADTATIRKVGVINDTYWDVCSREPWPFLEKTASLTFAGSSATPSNLPSDFSKALVITDPINDITVKWERADEIRRRYRATLAQAGPPSFYYFIAGNLNFYPVPPSSQTLDMIYTSWPPELLSTDLEAAIRIPPRHHRILVLGALYKLYSMEDDPELAQVFEASYDKRLAMMTDDLFRRQYDDPDRIFVLDDDEYFPFNGW